MNLSRRRGTRPARPAPSLAEQAYRQLEEMIVTLELPPNMLLSEDELARRLGIGRTPVREAVKRLALDGLVRVLPRRGLQVTEIDGEHELLLLEVRRELERLVARRAARERTQREADLFREYADSLERAATERDEETYLRIDKAFNDLLVRSARNPVAARSLAPLQSLSRRFWYSHYLYARDRIPLAGRYHAAIMRAVAAADPEAAGEAVDRLMDYVGEFTRSVIRPRSPEPDGRHIRAAPPADD